jgi:hypothetical protein
MNRQFANEVAQHPPHGGRKADARLRTSLRTSVLHGRMLSSGSQYRQARRFGGQSGGRREHAQIWEF